MALEKLTGVQSAFKPNTLNDILGIPCVGTTPGSETIALFGCGTGGAQLDWGNIVAPDIKQNNVIDLIPMRYASTLTGEDAPKYFMKKPNDDGSTYSWFLKEFASTPVIKSHWKNAVDSTSDGTEIVSDISDSGRTEGIETYAQFELTLNTRDMYEYFNATGNLAMARYNTFGFYTGEKFCKLCLSGLQSRVIKINEWKDMFISFHSFSFLSYIIYMKEVSSYV